jgi:hypothetical protein
MINCVHCNKDITIDVEFGSFQVVLVGLDGDYACNESCKNAFVDGMAQHVLNPNESTIEAMEEARSGKLPEFASIEELMKSLNVDN